MHLQILLEINFILLYNLGPVANYSDIYFRSREVLVGIDEEELSIDTYSLSNYPNPFNSTTIISFKLPKISDISLQIFNNSGELVKTLINNQRVKSGNHKVVLDLENYSSGVYYSKLTVNNKVVTAKHVYIR
ncbi:MAG: hypothetical protein CR982_04465, partial [Candidatus Cloacimonadota bacterium]